MIHNRGNGSAEDDNILDPDQSRRLRSLYDRQNRRALTDDEWAEMRELVAAYARRLGERRVREIAAQRGLTVEQVQAEATADIEQSLARRSELESDPARLKALVDEAWKRQRSRAVG